MRSRTSFLRIVKTAAIVMMMKIIAMVIVVMITYAGIRSPPTRPVVPIPRRVPASPVRTPKPIVNNRSVDIYRFYHIVRTIDIFIADNLYRDIVGLIFFHIYTGHVLVNVLSQNSLQHDQVLVAACCLYHTDIIHISVAVKIQVHQSLLRVV